MFQYLRIFFGGVFILRRLYYTVRLFVIVAIACALGYLLGGGSPEGLFLTVSRAFGALGALF